MNRFTEAIVFAGSSAACAIASLPTSTAPSRP
jgi:hypothetical protein